MFTVRYWRCFFGNKIPISLLQGVEEYRAKLVTELQTVSRQVVSERKKQQVYIKPYEERS